MEPFVLELSSFLNDIKLYSAGVLAIRDPPSVFQILILLNYYQIGSEAINAREHDLIVIGRHYENRFDLFRLVEIVVDLIRILIEELVVLEELLLYLGRVSRPDLFLPFSVRPGLNTNLILLPPDLLGDVQRMLLLKAFQLS